MLRWMGTTFAAGLMVAAGSAVWADDTVRLGGADAQSSISGGTNTELVQRRGGFYGGGRGYGGGYGRGYYGGGFGRSYYGGGYGRGYYGGGFGRSYYGVGWGNYGWGRGYYGGGWGGGYYGGYANRYYTPYFSGGYYSTPVYASYSYYPCAGEIAPTMTLQAQSSPQFMPAEQLSRPQQNVPQMPPASPIPGDFEYDGGPYQQVPMPIPGMDTNPAKAPRAIIPIDGKLVSMPSGISGGFSPVTLTPQPQSIVNNNVPRVNYPAYGDHR